MTSYRLTQSDLSSIEQAQFDDTIEEARPAEPTDRLPWRVAAPLLFGMCALAWGGVVLLFQT